MAAPFAEEAPEGDYKLMGLGLDFRRPQSPMSLDDFLALRAGHIAGEDLSVLQVIQHYAYVEGGVHLGVPTNATSDVLLISAADPPPFWPFLLGALANIAAVTTSACAQLEEIAASECERRKTNPRPDEIESPNARLGFPLPPSRSVSAGGFHACDDNALDVASLEGSRGVVSTTPPHPPTWR